MPGASRLVELVDVDPRLVRRFVSPMVGREREHRRLVDAFEQAIDDRSCQLFTVLGAAGVGKSRLVREFLERSAPARPLRPGAASPTARGSRTGRCWRRSTARGLEDADAPETTRSRLAALLDGSDEADRVAEQLARTIGASSDVAAVDESAWAIRRLFETLGARRPLVVVLDDVHWGEPTFLDLVEHLADWSRGVPILLLCIARPELFDARPGWGGGKPNATSVLLEPLSERRVRAPDRESRRRDRTGRGGALAHRRRGRGQSALRRGDAGDARRRRPARSTRRSLVGDGRSRHVPSRPRSRRCSRHASTSSSRSVRTVIEPASVEGKVSTRDGRGARARRAGSRALTEALVRKELIRPECRLLGERALPLPAPADPGRGVRLDHEGGAAAAARAVHAAGSRARPARARPSTTRSSATTSSRRAVPRRGQTDDERGPALAQRAAQRLGTRGDALHA